MRCRGNWTRTPRRTGQPDGKQKILNVIFIGPDKGKCYDKDSLKKKRRIWGPRKSETARLNRRTLVLSQAQQKMVASADIAHSAAFGDSRDTWRFRRCAVYLYPVLGIAWWARLGSRDIAFCRWTSASAINPSIRSIWASITCKVATLGNA
jgi:hypothetical protein